MYTAESPKATPTGHAPRHRYNRLNAMNFYLLLRTAAMMSSVFCDTLQDVEECIAKEELQTGIKYIRRTTTAGFATDGIERFSES